MGFSTDAIHAGQHPDAEANAVITPIYMTTTYKHTEYGKNKGYTYSRAQNPTRAAMEANVAAMEKGKYGIAFSSGVAAVNSIVSLLSSGDHVIASDQIYGGTYRLFETILRQFGIRFSWVDTTKIENIAAEIRPETRMVFIETPSNPLLHLTDIVATANLCRQYEIISVIDNTFMTPYFQKPLELGMDIVIHSSSKYLNGHSDVIGGIVITNEEKLHNKIRYYQKAAGAVPSPFDCWLTLRSTKTLAVRMERHNANAMKTALYLGTLQKVERVMYPGLKDHPQHKLAKKQMNGFGGIVAVYLDSFETTKKLLNSLRVITLAESLGGVESLICQPYTTTHQSVPPAEKEKLGITKNLVRISVGIEDIEDILEDLHSSLK